MTALSKAYYATDASLAEINPFILTKDGKVYALDAKITFDDNALYRHKELVELRDLNEEDPLEVEASRYGLNYIKLDGTVGCMVNGAGLPWPPWTSLSSRAARRPTSWTWAAGRAPNRSRMPSASCSRIDM